MSDFVSRMEDVCKKIVSRSEKVVGNEQASKESLIKPFFTAMGYDTEDPDLWSPEYNADFPGRKKSEKVDYAILKDGEPVILIEAKAFSASNSALQSRDGQLARYFNATSSSQLAIITNGVVYRFFTDLEQPNVQDQEPFYCFDCRTATTEEFQALEQFSRGKFDVGQMRSWADDRKNNDRIRKFLAKIITEPEKCEEFVRLVVDMTYDGNKSKAVLEKFAQKIPSLMRSALDSSIRERLGLADAKASVESVDQPKQLNSGHTTQEEMSAFYAIRGILAGAGKDTSSVVFKDATNWFNVSKDKGGNWFVRLYFNDDPKQILVRMPMERCLGLLGDGLDVVARQAGTLITLKDDLDLSSLARAICETFDSFEQAKTAHDGETEDADVRKAS